MSSTSEIIVVSGLPRSGTSLMMQMLAQGGIEIVTDAIREADTDNPRGYCEFEKVKKMKQDASWLPEIRGKAVKMVSQLLYDLPPTEHYSVLFMERDLDEVLASQEKMLQRLGRTAAPRDQMKRSFGIHLERLAAWLPQQAHLRVQRISYNSLLADAVVQAERIREFLGGRPHLEGMLGAIDPGLYRNRNLVPNPV